MTPTTLTELNRSTRHEFVRLIGPVFEHSPWIADATWDKRPFRDPGHLHGALCDTVRASEIQKQLGLIQAHPDLVGKAAQAGTLTPSSTGEQTSAGLNQLSPEEIGSFQRYNQAYRDKFGFPFVICARLNKKDAILKAFPLRLENSREQEIRTALEEIYKIAYFRLEDIVRPD
jgi:2-oxo-4-hydroxy-4-carboxy-5-ureidoimidazoline decarboxylase